MKVGNIYRKLDIYYLITYYTDRANFVNDFLANSNRKPGCVGEEMPAALFLFRDMGRIGELDQIDHRLTVWRLDDF